jgi:hypothetical protein
VNTGRLPGPHTGAGPSIRGTRPFRSCTGLRGTGAHRPRHAGAHDPDHEPAEPAWQPGEVENLVRRVVERVRYDSLTGAVQLRLAALDSEAS